MTIHVISCRCSRWQVEPAGTYLYGLLLVTAAAGPNVRADCPYCKGSGWVFIRDDEIWKFSGISMA